MLKVMSNFFIFLYFRAGGFAEGINYLSCIYTRVTRQKQMKNRKDLQKHEISDENLDFNHGLHHFIFKMIFFMTFFFTFPKFDVMYLQ